MNYDLLMSRLRERLDANYRDYLSRSAAWSPQERREHTEEIQNTEFAYDALLKEGGTEPALRYLLHFKDPLRIVANQVTGLRVLGCPEGDTPLGYALWRILNTRDADNEYALEDAFQPPGRDAEALLDELAVKTQAEYQAYLTDLEALPKAELIQKAAEMADMEHLLSGFLEDSSEVPAADLCFLCRAANPLRAFYEFLCGQEELSALDHFETILEAYNEGCEEAALLGNWNPTLPAQKPAPLPDNPKDWLEFLQKRIDAEYEDLEKGWLRMQPSELIENAQEIAGVQMVHEVLMVYTFEEGDVENLLRFSNPLSKAASYWAGGDAPTAQDVRDDMVCVFSRLAENEPWPKYLEQGQPGEPSLC